MTARAAVNSATGADWLLQPAAALVPLDRRSADEGLKDVVAAAAGEDLSRLAGLLA
jgi:hypothetical protein